MHLLVPSVRVNLGSEAELTIFRIIQESLSNILRHSGGREATIRITVDSNVCWEVIDNGHGFKAGSPDRPAAAGTVGVGIAGMKERMRHLGGTLSIKSGPQGTILKAIFPIETQIHADRSNSHR